MGKVRRRTRIQHAAEHVGDMGQRHELRTRRQHGLERAEVDPVILGQRAHVDHRTSAFGNHLPGHDVRMVFKRGQHDAVACRQARHAPARSDEVDRLGRAAHEDDLVFATGANELRNALAGGLVGHRHVRAAAIDPAVHGCVIAAQRAAHRVDHRLRFLRRRRRVEIMPRRALARQQAGKIRLAGKGRHLAHRCLSSLSSATCSRRSCSASSSSATSASPIKACTSRRRERSGERPRAAM